MLKRILASVVLSLMLTGGAAAGPFEEAWDADQRGDHATAMRLWRPLAEQGDAAAQSLLGIMYYEGQGVPQDYAEAVKWYRLAAEQGNATAQNNLGGMYDNGRGASSAWRLNGAAAVRDPSTSRILKKGGPDYPRACPRLAVRVLGLVDDRGERSRFNARPATLQDPTSDPFGVEAGNAVGSGRGWRRHRHGGHGNADESDARYQFDRHFDSPSVGGFCPAETFSATEGAYSIRRASAPKGLTRHSPDELWNGADHSRWRGPVSPRLSLRQQEALDLERQAILICRHVVRQRQHAALGLFHAQTRTVALGMASASVLGAGLLGEFL